MGLSHCLLCKTAQTTLPTPPPLTRDPPPPAAAGSWVFEYVCVRIEMLLQSTKAVRFGVLITHWEKHLLAHFLSLASKFYRPFVSDGYNVGLRARCVGRIVTFFSRPATDTLSRTLLLLEGRGAGVCMKVVCGEWKCLT